MFSLKWNQFSEHIVTALQELRENDDFTDVTLSCDGKYIKAHKILLSVCSSYFKEIFNSNPCKHPVVIFNRVDYNNLQTLITFMYHGEVHISQENLSTFLETAELLQIKGLTDFSGEAGGGGEDHHPHHQQDQIINNNTSRHSRSASPQHTYGFSSSASHDLMTASANTISNPILKVLSKLSQPQPSGPSSLSSFTNIIDAHNSSSYSSLPSSTLPPSQVPLIRPVVLVSNNIINDNNNKSVRSNGAKTSHTSQASSSSSSRFSTTGNIINSNSNNNRTTTSPSTDSLNHQPNAATNLSMTNGADHFPRNMLTIKNEQGEFVYEEEFPTVTGTTRAGEGQVKLDHNKNATVAAAIHSVIVPAPGYVRRSNSTATTTTMSKNESSDPNCGTSSSVLEEALLGRKRCSSNTFNGKNHHFLKNKDATKLAPNNNAHNGSGGGPPKLHREVPLLNCTSSSSISSTSTFPSQSRQPQPPFQSRSNLASNQNRNGQVSARTVASPNSSDMPLDLEMEKKVEPANYKTSGSSNSISKGQSLARAPPVDNNMDLHRQDLFFHESQLNLSRNRQSPPQSRPAPVSFSSLTSASSHAHQQQQQQKIQPSVLPQNNNDNSVAGENNSNVKSGSSRSLDHSHGIIPPPHYSVSHQLLKSAKATVRAKEKQQQQQQQSGTTASTSATIKARVTKTRNIISSSSGHTSTGGGTPSKIRRVSSYSNVNGSSPSIKSKASSRQGKSNQVGQDLTFQSIHNRNDTGVAGPYICNLCGKRYVHHRSLNDHKKFHMGATRCQICNKSFSKVANLRAHFVNAHKNGYVV